MKASKPKPPVAPLPVLPAGPTINLSWLICAWVMLIALGFMILRIDHSLGAANQVSVPRAAMMSVNVGTATGFEMNFAKPAEFHATVQFTFVIQTLTCTLMSLIAGGALLSRVAGAQHTEAEIVGTSLLLIALAAILGALVTSGSDGTFDARTQLLYSIFAGIGALGNSGLAFGSNGVVPNFATYAVFLPLGIFGAQGVVVILDLWKWLVHHKMPTATSLRMMTMTAVLFLAGTFLLTLLTIDWENPEVGAFLNATRWAINSPSLGLPIDHFGKFPRSVPAMVLILIALGFGTFGTNGGIGLLTACTLPKWARPKIFTALAIFWSLIALVTVILLNNLPEVAPEQLLMLTVSSAFNSGVSHNPIAFGSESLFLLVVLMLVGRMVPLVLLWWLDQGQGASSSDRAD